MRHLMISAAYAFTCLAFCVLAVTVAKERQTVANVEENVVAIKEKVSTNKDDASQSLTTQHPKPTKSTKSL